RRGPLRLLDHREMRRRAAEALDEIGVDVPSVELAVGALSGGQRQAIVGARGDIAIVMIAHNYAQTLEICDRVILMQHGEVTFESQAAATSAEELLEIVRREYRAVRAG